jgi:anaerobic magnesium-protoporphyrin IX monomethyl ester cyclase
VNITLIELNVADTSAIGVRSLAACLKRAGHQVQLLFLANAGEKDDSNRYFYPDYVGDQVISLCKKSKLVGLSFLSSGFHRARQLTERLKNELDLLVIWGGIHATVEPEQCLNYADGVCRGEGEAALVELVQRLDAGQDFYVTQNFCFKKDGQIISNPVRPLLQDLDALPFLDYDLAGDHFALVEKRKEFYPLDKALLLDFITPKWHRADIGDKPVYSTMASRGCPHTCAYCFHSIYKPMYPRQRYIRRRSPENIIEELKQFINLYDFQGIIWFSDDDFTAASTGQIKEFSELYKRKIGLPFFCLGSPTTLNEPKMEYLTEAGLQFFEYGIQTGSTKTKKFFNRSFSSEQIISDCKIINKFKDKIPLPYYDFILDSPCETVEDKVETLNLILELPKPYHLALASFRYFPGSVLYETAKKDGLITIETQQLYSGEFTKIKGNYINFLIILFTCYRIPQIVIKIFSSQKVVNLLNRKFLADFYTIPYKIYQLIRRFL